jgi:phage minor structural protein
LIIDLDVTKKLIRPKLMLAKPNKEIISPIPEFYDGKQTITLGKVNELNFNIPIEIDHKHKLTRNKNVDLIKEKFLIKFTKGTNYTEWYIVDKITRHMDEDKEYMSYQCFSLPYELSRKHIKDYSVVSKTATQVLTDALNETIWSISYMDANFDLKYRAFDVTTKSVLDFVFEIAEKYNALIIWDTNNRQVSFYDLDAIGSNKGLKVKYGKLLDNITYEENTDEIATRLKVFGRDGISINKLQPTGVNYLENYSHYLYPFSRDGLGVVITSSDYFSDSLSNSLLDYEELVESKQGEFDILLSDLTTLEGTLTTKENELFNLENELAVINDDLDTANANGTDNTLILADKSAKETEIDTKKAEIASIEIGITVDTSASVSGSVTFTVDGSTVVVSLAAGDTTSTVASKINTTFNNLYPTYKSTVSTNVTNIKYYSSKAKETITVSFVDTDSTGVTLTLTTANFGIENQIAAVDIDINTLKNSVAIENNFTVAELEEWNPFIIVKEWANDNYTDEQELYDAGLEEFEKIRIPKIIAEIGIVNLLEILELQKSWEKLNIGDTIVIEHEKLGIDVTAKMMEFHFDYESGDISVVIANVKEIMNDKEKFMQEHYNSISSSTVFSQSKIKYDDAKATTDEVSNIINATWDAVARDIKAGNNNEIEISRRGLRVYDPNDPLNVLIIQNGVLALSNDSGNNWKTAITPSGIVKEKIKFKLLNKSL